MCEPAIHVLMSMFTRLVRHNAFASVATLIFFSFSFSYPTTTESDLTKCLKPSFLIFIFSSPNTKFP